MSDLPIELNGVADALACDKGCWRSCSGCHELNEGAPTGPYSPVMKCHLGMGCFECGGIGAVWDTTDYADLGRALENAETETPIVRLPVLADMPAYGRCIPTDLLRALAMAMFDKDDATLIDGRIKPGPIGHQMVPAINFNSLNRIVSTFYTRPEGYELFNALADCISFDRDSNAVTLHFSEVKSAKVFAGAILPANRAARLRFARNTKGSVE